MNPLDADVIIADTSMNFLVAVVNSPEPDLSSFTKEAKAFSAIGISPLNSFTKSSPQRTIAVVSTIIIVFRDRRELPNSFIAPTNPFFFPVVVSISFATFWKFSASIGRLFDSAINPTLASIAKLGSSLITWVRENVAPYMELVFVIFAPAALAIRSYSVDSFLVLPISSKYFGFWVSLAATNF